MAIQTSRQIALGELAKAVAAEVEPVLERMTRTCLTCEHWRDENAKINPNQCGLYNALPPPRIIAYGCDKFMEIIPF